MVMPRCVSQLDWLPGNWDSSVLIYGIIIIIHAYIISHISYRRYIRNQSQFHSITITMTHYDYHSISDSIAVTQYHSITITLSQYQYQYHSLITVSLSTITHHDPWFEIPSSGQGSDRLCNFFWKRPFGLVDGAVFSNLLIHQFNHHV